ncbi:hypothetical protein JIN85_01110 [Luteolibacter pohnpeiensis]|uniref:Uncharacterized protein n=1 Tax=Luteolibacter pohnpeiensis TaxID=454153 RepID=A0A934S239_9BACT|nr:hypothetical protein [Luteolibacter pohnpeiensis]MBK1880991.1 hypothetical protein [Luteolibacter pohnpeiensis]
MIKIILILLMTLQYAYSGPIFNVAQKCELTVMKLISVTPTFSEDISGYQDMMKKVNGEKIDKIDQSAIMPWGEVIGYSLSDNIEVEDNVIEEMNEWYSSVRWTDESVTGKVIGLSPVKVISFEDDEDRSKVWLIILYGDQVGEFICGFKSSATFVQVRPDVKRSTLSSELASNIWKTITRSDKK